MNQLDVAVVSIFAITIVSLGWIKSTRPKVTLPPSPKSYPFLGNIPVMPTKDEHIVYRDWSRELKSDAIRIQIPGTNLIILNSARAALTLLEKSSSNLLSRPKIPVIDTDLFDLTRLLALLRYGERWKHSRQLMHLSFRKSAVPMHFEAQTKHARIAATRILERPDDYVRILSRMLGSQILSCVYGYEATLIDDEILQLAENASVHLGKTLMPFNFLVNIMPWLKRIPSWFPGTGWKKTTREWSQEFVRTITLPYEYTIAQMTTGTAKNSALSEILQSFSNQGEPITEEQKDLAIWTAGSVFTAAVDSLHATLQVIMLLMTVYQHVQIKAQKEIDGVTNGKRLPEISDLQDMPYTRSVILEALRWLPVTPLGLPRICEDDVQYNGYTIPKGALVFGNIWAINRDPEKYHDAETFLPERFMDPNTPEPATFGFGRRICPGMHFAQSSLFINVATILSIFRIRPVQDEQGKDIVPEIGLEMGVLAMNPIPFECTITPRSEEHCHLLTDEIYAD
ncbi:O-methylsterigmatocystin oxidoreductase OS=Aspergillus parasiticus GN=ordA PE=3 SV=1 [Rhizoctonia solani AG-1 IB]|uniref:O-methylsterigmatocystin oxidoreductase n=1 Tax=Thanatephorus cucumeris (strain AG1-IB / isolate 7/3/14) TaxID=1108050 RepID=A0A0B7FE18_THACB|nr:O-methylsterigmatocystin oxidoreductase OS=Aspergillus parasiticus GN=ordA PE=3 SV=1 [Rhizoctonia solani AG-1 IB]